MLNIYGILRASSRFKSTRLKLFGVWMMHVLGKRYIGVFLDPVLACNFRCRMCYFSDDEKQKTYRGLFKYEDIECIAKAFFHRALKLQIGCGAEPTLHKDLINIIALGKRYQVPYISLTTNGNLLNREKLREAIEAGLDELTLSVHGFTKQTYEFLMTNGNFEMFKRLLNDISQLKKQYTRFKLRINYTINNDNLDELTQIWDVLGTDVDVLQLRPIQNLGVSAYSDFDLTRIYHKYDTIITPIIQECNRRNITCLVPCKENLTALENSFTDNRLEQATYCYISPKGCWKDDFDYKTESFESYAYKHHYAKKLWGNIFKSETKTKVNVSRKLNYNIK